MLKKAADKFAVFLLTALAVSICILRFFQLLKFTDSSTGLINCNERLSFAVYFLYVPLLVLSLLCAKSKKDLPVLFSDKGSKLIFSSSAFLSLMLFCDFIHQCYNCFLYLQNNAYIEYVYIVSLGISGFFALISSFYFLIFAISQNDNNYDFKNFTLFHFVPVLWIFSRLLIIMLKIVDIKEDVETVCEFIFLVVALCFYIAFISAIDKKKKAVSSFFLFLCLSNFLLCAVVALPRIAIILSGNSDVLYNVTFSSMAYLSFGIFTMTIFMDINKRIKEKR